jgi:hypothetical protein
MAQIRDVGDGIRGGTYTMTAPVITGGSISGTTFVSSAATITGGSINNTTVGATTRSTGAFTTLASNGATTFTAGTASTSTTTGTAVITGGLGVSGRINAANFDGIVGANTAAAGNFTTLGATGVATFSAGTVSAPAITTTGDTNTGIFFPAADTIAFTEGGVESMRIDSSGNVGIGINNGGAYGKFGVGGSGYQAMFALSTDASGAVGILAANSSSEVRMGSATNHPLALYTNGTEKVRIDTSGNVGIGTSGPTGGGGGTILNIFGSSAASFRVNTSTVTFDTFISGSTAFIQTGTNHPLNFRINGTTRMVMDTSGNVGVGTGASTITDRFTVAGAGEVGGVSDAGGKDAAIRVASTDGSANSGGQIEFGSGYGSYTQSYFAAIKSLLNNGSSNSTGNLAFYTRNAVADTSLTERMRIVSGGQVGIGVTAPTFPLEIQCDAAAFGLALRGRSDDISVLRFVNNAANTTLGQLDIRSTAFIINAVAAAPMQFHTSNTERMRIAADGTVGIGTSNPAGIGGLLSVVTGTNNGPGYFRNTSTSGITSDQLQVGVSQSTSLTSFYLSRFYTNVTTSPAVMHHVRGDGQGYFAGDVGIGTSSPAAKLDVAGPIKTLGYTVATLPAGVTGMRAYVTDALAPSFGVTVAGSGAVTIPVFYNGANWIVA